ncbi:MAG: dihydrodipicolinate synthase family protein [Chloroflexota bacterium]|nr:dihydrodipicolinate synthase family protein [Chloroflexota bacterium]
MDISGVYPPIATPFNAEGSVDRDALEANVQKWNETGLAGYVVAGSNGESVLLEAEEVLEAVRAVRDAALPAQRVIAGTGRQSTAATIRLTEKAAEAGAEIALVMTPCFYAKEMTPAALIQHYERLADASPLPILIYNVPKFTHLNISPETVAYLAAHERILGIKDSAGDIGQIIDLVRLCPSDFNILVGNGPAFFSALQAGACGGILALANVAPRECVAIWELVNAGRYEEAREIHYRLMPVGRAVTSAYGIPGLKGSLDLLGYRGGNPRPPLLPADGTTRERLKEILVAAKLLSPSP